MVLVEVAVFAHSSHLGRVGMTYLLVIKLVRVMSMSGQHQHSEEFPVSGDVCSFLD